MKTRAFLLSSIGVFGICLARAEFVPVDFEGFGFKDPNIRFILDSNDNQESKGVITSLILNNARSAIMINIGFIEEFSPGFSVSAEGGIVNKFYLIEDKAFRNLAGEISNPLNYGERHIDYTAPKKETKVDSAIEISDGSSYCRMYFNTDLEYCWFFSPPDNRSSTWLISPGLAKALKHAIKNSRPIATKVNADPGQ